MCVFTAQKQKRKELDELQKKISELSIYEYFLKDVCKQSDEFMNEEDKDEPNIQSIIDRYESL